VDFSFARVRDRVRFLYRFIGLLQQGACITEKRAPGIR
jgi:hypothetical protein